MLAGERAFLSPPTRQARARLAGCERLASLSADVDVMPEAHPFTFIVRRNAWHWGLFGWIIFERQREREVSRMTYATQREAEEAAKARMIQLIDGRRSGRQ
jgi:hypothetical protein